MAEKNKERAETARLCMSRTERYDDCTEDEVVDLMIDLLHYARSQGFDVPSIQNRVQTHYIAELMGD
jgi:hypothetical protein